LVRRNARKAPVGILVLQAILVVFLSLLYFIFDEINQAYWVLTASAAQLYMLMYLIMFAACWKLRHLSEQRADVFNIPGGMLGLGCVCVLGFLGSFSALFIGFIPPEIMHFAHMHYFIIGMFALLVILTVPAYFLGKRTRV
jgi:glutamate:GABA antiporter